MAGDINTLVLSAIKDKNLYGLEIIKHIYSATNGGMLIKQPSLYSALRRLETRGFVTSYWEDSELGGKRHYYSITKLGLDYLKHKLSRQESASAYLDKTANEINEDDLDANNQHEAYNSNTQKNNFSSYMRQYVEPKNDFSEYKFKEETITKNNQKEFKPLFFPDVDEDLDFDEELDDDNDSENRTNYSDEIKIDEVKTNDDIDFKDILGDILQDDSPISPTKTNATNNQSSDIKNQNISNTDDDSQRVLNKSREYAKEIAQILSKKDSAGNDKYSKKEITNPQSIELLEEISKRHKDTENTLNNDIYTDNDTNNGNDYFSEENNNSSQGHFTQQKKDYINFGPTYRKDNKYIYINKLKMQAQVVLFFIVFAEILGMFIAYFIQGWNGLEQYILFGCALFIDLIFLIGYIVNYKKYPDKKIRKNINWLANFFYRLIATVLLIVLSVSINLLLGMDSFTEPTYMLRWLLPCVLIINILIQWIVYICMSKMSKFNT